MPSQVKVPCQAVAIRFTADPRTDEFLNVGVVLFCPARQYAGARFLTSWARISNAFPTADLVHLRRVRRLFEKACEQWAASTQQPDLFESVESVGALIAGIISFDDAALRFSPAISGVTANPDATLAELFRLYVAKDDEEGTAESRDDDTVWRQVMTLATPTIVQSLTRHTLRSSHYEQIFDRSWKNGAWNAAQPVSLDLKDPQAIRDKALLWASRLHELRPAEHETMVHFLVGLPSDDRPKDVRKAAGDAFEILHDLTSRDDARVIPEAKAPELIKKIETDLEHARAAAARQ